MRMPRISALAYGSLFLVACGEKSSPKSMDDKLKQSPNEVSTLTSSSSSDTTEMDLAVKGLELTSGIPDIFYASDDEFDKSADPFIPKEPLIGAPGIGAPDIIIDDPIIPAGFDGKLFAEKLTALSKKYAGSRVISASAKSFSDGCLGIKSEQLCSQGVVEGFEVSFSYTDVVSQKVLSAKARTNKDFSSIIVLDASSVPGIGAPDIIIDDPIIPAGFDGKLFAEKLTALSKKYAGSRVISASAKSFSDGCLGIESEQLCSQGVVEGFEVSFSYTDVVSQKVLSAKARTNKDFSSIIVLDASSVPGIGAPDPIITLPVVEQGNNPGGRCEIFIGAACPKLGIRAPKFFLDKNQSARENIARCLVRASAFHKKCELTSKQIVFARAVSKDSKVIQANRVGAYSLSSKSKGICSIQVSQCHAHPKRNGVRKIEEDDTAYNVSRCINRAIWTAQACQISSKETVTAVFSSPKVSVKKVLSGFTNLDFIALKEVLSSRYPEFKDAKGFVLISAIKQKISDIVHCGGSVVSTCGGSVSVDGYRILLSYKRGNTSTIRPTETASLSLVRLEVSEDLRIIKIITQGVQSPETLPHSVAE